MAWLAVDSDNSEYIYKERPTRYANEYWESDYGYVHMYYGSIKRLIGRELTWADEPVEI